MVEFYVNAGSLFYVEVFKGPSVKKEHLFKGEYRNQSSFILI